jgi:2-polyprenyl-3-methyl-5-hydroxy-6-metoxy-1,4-benzoquinol methylase
MLEIGCASGVFMHRMASAGWEVEGIEFSPQAATNARALGYSVHAGSLEAAPDPEEPYDLIVGWMVLEHLHEPILALEKLRRWIRPGGWLVLSVPNAGSVEFRVFKTRWYALQLPTHLTHFTPKTLQATLARAGWRTDRILHQQNLGNLVASLGYCLEDLGIGEQITEKFTKFPERLTLGHYLLFPIATLASWFGQTGRMTVWARVPG